MNKFLHRFVMQVLTFMVEFEQEHVAQLVLY